MRFRMGYYQYCIKVSLLDCSAAQAVTFETTTRLDKGTSPTTGDARPVYTTVTMPEKVAIVHF